MNYECNIDYHGRLKRKLMGMGMFALALLQTIAIFAFHLSVKNYLILFCTFFFGFLGYLQSKKGVCVILASVRREEMKGEIRKVKDGASHSKVVSVSIEITIKSFLYSAGMIFILHLFAR